jgi:hypothetical protein
MVVPLKLPALSWWDVTVALLLLSPKFSLTRTGGRWGVRSAWCDMCAKSTFLLRCLCSLTHVAFPRLLSSTKEKVVLFVAHDNAKANGVYHRVGFVGLNSAAGSVPLVRPWLEIGFDRKFVELGHW